MHIHRKILFGAAAIVLPVSTVGLIGATTGVASASKAPPNPPITCSVSGTVHFASPGITKSGSEDTSKTSQTTTSGDAASSCGAGGSSIPNLTISTKSTKCKGAGNPDAVCTAKGEFEYGSWGDFVADGTMSITKSIKKLSVELDGVTYLLKTTNAADTACFPTSGPTEVGFAITGEVKSPKADKGETSTLTACLGTDTGPDTTGTFAGDYNSSTATVATATIDGQRGGQHHLYWVTAAWPLIRAVGKAKAVVRGGAERSHP